MKKATVIVSLILHGGFAIALLTASQKRASGKSHYVQMLTEKKKVAVKEVKPPPPKPKKAKIENKPAPKPATQRAEPVREVQASKPTLAPVVTDIAMSNEDVGDGVAIPVERPPQAVAPGRVASFDAEPRKKRLRDVGSGPLTDSVCTDEPSKPEPIYKTEIEYTASARSEGIEGKLKLRITVGADGEVANVEILASVSPELDAAAVAAVKRWRFKPAMACGKPVSGGTYVLARRFELGD